MKTVDLAEAEADRAIFTVTLLQRVLRETEGHVDIAHLDAVLAGIAHDLRRRIEAHRLRVQKRAAEGVGMPMLEPGGNIDKLREARGMAFRETIGAETLDLVKAALGEFRRIAARDHVADQLGFVFADGAEIAERRHRAAQAVGLL